MRVAATGATGYIGERLVARALSHGHEIVALTRRAPEGPLGWQKYDIGDTGRLELPAGLEALIHLAATTVSADFHEERELQAANRLIEAAARAGARFVFVSSQTARVDAPTSYGRAKWAIERAVLAAGGVVVRPGQVYGGPERGLFGMLVRLVRRLPLLPAFRPAAHVQLIHIDDLTEALLRAAAAPDLAGVVLSVAEATPISFTEFLGAIARYRLRSTRVFVPMPLLAIRAAQSLAGKGLSARLGLDRLGSLIELKPMDTAADLACLGLTLRPLDIALARGANGARRAQIEESRALLTYVLRASPRSSLLRRHVRAIEQLRCGSRLRLPALVLRWPALIALFEGVGASELDARLNAAVMLAEASPEGARRFLRIGAQSGFLRAGVALGLALLAETGWRVASLALAPWLRQRSGA